MSGIQETWREEERPAAGIMDPRKRSSGRDGPKLGRQAAEVFGVLFFPSQWTSESVYRALLHHGDVV